MTRVSPPTAPSPPRPHPKTGCSYVISLDGFVAHIKEWRFRASKGSRVLDGQGITAKEKQKIHAAMESLRLAYTEQAQRFEAIKANNPEVASQDRQRAVASRLHMQMAALRSLVTDPLQRLRQRELARLLSIASGLRASRPIKLKVKGAITKFAKQFKGWETNLRSSWRKLVSMRKEGVSPAVLKTKRAALRRATSGHQDTYRERINEFFEQLKKLQREFRDRANTANEL